MNPELFKAAAREEPPQFERTTSTGPENWIQESQLMGLPLFTTQYIQLVHVPLDVMHECLQLQLELRLPQKPSLHSVRQVRAVRSSTVIYLVMLAMCFYTIACALVLTCTP